MTGRENGVAALIKRKNSYFISVHCAAHRLALASLQAADKVEVIAQYQKSLCLLSIVISVIHVFILNNWLLFKEY